MERPPVAKSVKHFPHLDGLRGLLALYVLGHHFLSWNVPAAGPVTRGITAAFQFGHPAVGFFIVLSGYSLMLPVAASPGAALRGGFGGYLVRRARRILPPYYGALGLSIAALLLVRWAGWPAAWADPGYELSFASLLSHLTLTHTWAPGQAFTINTALWSVATEWHIYFLFPLLLLPVWRRHGAAALLAAAFGLGLLPQVVLGRGYDASGACPWYVGLFAIGMTGAMVATAPRPSIHRHRAYLPLAFAASTAAYLVLKWLRPGADAGGMYSIQWLKDAAVGCVAWCVLVGCARAVATRAGGSVRRPGPVLRLLESRPAVALGGFSYSLYATHCATLTAVKFAADRWHLAPAPALMLRGLVGMPAALAVAYAFSLWFEAPFLRGRARPAPAPALPAPRDLPALGEAIGNGLPAQG